MLKRGSGRVYVSDFADFAIYLDALEADVERWYLNRFLTLRNSAFQDPESYFHRYAQLSDEEAVDGGRRASGSARTARTCARTSSPRGRARTSSSRRAETTSCPVSCCGAREPRLRLARDRLRVRRQRLRAPARAEGAPRRGARVRAALQGRRAAEVHVGRAALLLRAAAGDARDLPADDLPGRRDRERVRRRRRVARLREHALSRARPLLQRPAVGRRSTTGRWSSRRTTPRRSGCSA